MCVTHSPIQCIIPPHMLDTIKRRGDARQRQMAESIEKVCDQTRRERASVVASAAAAGVAKLVASAAPAAKHREVHDGEGGAALPGAPARSEGEPATGDPAVDEAFDYSGDTYDLFSDVYGRSSLDGKGLPLVSTVHHRAGYNNAFWNGTQMVYGDGDGQLFVRFTRSRSVVGHELSHGVVEFSGGLEYSYQSGALNEHVADVFGCMVDQRAGGQEAAEASWLVGQGILAPGVQGEALRSMKAPGTAYDDPVLGKDPQPFHMKGYVQTSQDNGGVHINSGIPNHAFYLLAQYLGGRAWEKAGTIWYDALQQLKNPYAQFAEWAEGTVRAAAARHGSGSAEERFTRRAWVLVGVL